MSQETTAGIFRQPNADPGQPSRVPWEKTPFRFDFEGVLHFDQKMSGQGTHLNSKLYIKCNAVHARVDKGSLNELNRKIRCIVRDEPLLSKAVRETGIEGTGRGFARWVAVGSLLVLLVSLGCEETGVPNPSKYKRDNNGSDTSGGGTDDRAAEPGGHPQSFPAHPFLPASSSVIRRPNLGWPCSHQRNARHHR